MGFEWVDFYVFLYMRKMVFICERGVGGGREIEWKEEMEGAD